MNLDDILVIGAHTEVSSFNENSYLIINNITGKYIKINQNFYQIIQLFDGKRDLRKIHFEYNKTYQNITQEKVLIVSEKLDKIGIFETSPNINQRKKLPPYLSFGFIFLILSITITFLLVSSFYIFLLICICNQK